MVNDNPTTNDGNGEAESAQTPGASAAVSEADGSNTSETAADNAEHGAESDTHSYLDSSDEAIIVSLRTQLENALADAQTHKEQAVRAVAEADNVRKRAQRDQENARKFALERFVNELLPVKDSLELGLAAAADEVNLVDLKEGTQMTLRMFVSAIEKFGVKEIAPLGEAFDADFHQAMTMRESDNHESGTVLDVVQKGYTLNDRLVRPAMVIVAK